MRALNEHVLLGDWLETLARLGLGGIGLISASCVKRLSMVYEENILSKFAANFQAVKCKAGCQVAESKRAAK
jgi:hypothetical protein